MKKHLIPVLSAQKIKEFEAFRFSGESLENASPCSKNWDDKREIFKGAL